MNSLSWLLYLADVSEGARWVAMFSMIICGLITAGSLVVWWAIVSESPTDDQEQEVKKWVGRVWSFFAPVFVISMMVFILVPQRQTLMLIAASEIGETVLASSQAQAIGGEAGELAVDSLRVLRQFITEQLDAPTEGIKE